MRRVARLGGRSCGSSLHIGKTGKELNTHLNGSTLPAREDLFITNLYRTYHGKDYEYTADDLAQDEPDLLAELKAVQPKLIITMGRHSTRWFLGDVSMDDVHGIAWQLLPQDKLAFLDPACVVFPMYHLAAGFHSPDISGCVTYDFQELQAYFAGHVEPRVLHDDPFPHPTYTEITDPRDICIDPRLPLALDTEGLPRAPWSLQYSQHPGEGFLIRAGHAACVREFAQILPTLQHPITVQGALHELSIFRALGIPMPPFEDTQVMAYLLQVEPRGLKPLCTRHCNMRMDSYEEIVGDAADRLARDYYVALWDCEQADHEDRQWHEFDRACVAGKRIRVLPKLPKTPLHKAVERGLRSRTPRKLWEDWEETQPHIRAAAVQRLGFMPEATLDHVNPAKAIGYGCRDADGTGRLEPELRTRIRAQGLEDVYRLELGTYPLIDRMSAVGIKPDLAHFAALSQDLAMEIADRQVKLEAETGIEGFNANSGDQVAHFLFEVLGLEGTKKTDSGTRYSTNDKILEALEHEHPDVPVLTTIRDVRELTKLKFTFVDQIPAFTHRWPFDERIHATFRTTRVVTGRLAASDPNLLAQPKHGQFAKRFRRGWVAEEGHLLAEWDLSQVELRVLAHLSQDPVMLAVYRGELRNPDGSRIDLHAALAERIFGVKPKDQDGSKHRLPAKAVNFGLPMGMTCHGLMIELRKNGLMLDEDDAQRWIDETMRLYKGVPRYQQGKIAEARRQGYVRCLSGRIRYIGGTQARDERIRAEAERFAFSTPIQEGAQWIMKRAEGVIWQEVCLHYQHERRYVEPLLQVHDALDFELEEDPRLAQEVHRRMVAVLTDGPPGFSVPIETSGDVGRNLCHYDPKDPHAEPGRDMIAFEEYLAHV